MIMIDKKDNDRQYQILFQAIMICNIIITASVLSTPIKMKSGRHSVLIVQLDQSYQSMKRKSIVHITMAPIVTVFIV